MRQIHEEWWHFHCPECGVGDDELGHLLGAADIHCIVCLQDDGRHVRLRRWLVAELPQDHADPPEVLTAA